MPIQSLWRRSKAKPEVPVRPRVVIFDFDGTIADTFECGFQILNKLAGEFGFRSLTREDLEVARNMRTRQLMKFLEIPMTKMSKIARRGSEELSARIDEVKPLPGMAEAIRDLQAQGYLMGIITSNTGANVTKFLKNHDLEYFDFIRSSSKLMGKASEIRAAKKKLKVRRAEMLFIGDETRDVSAAQKYGVPIAAVTWGYNSQQVLEGMKPDWIFHKPQELVDMLASFKAKEGPPRGGPVVSG